MLIYKRDNKTTVTLLRASFFLIVGLCTYLFLSGYKDYCFVLLFLLACGSVFPVTGLRLSKETLTIRQYYVYALFSRTWTFQNGNGIEVHPFDLEISDAGYLNTDEWWDIFFVLMPVSKTTIKKFIIKHTDIINNKTQIKIKLTKEELELIHRACNRESVAHTIGSLD